MSVMPSWFTSPSDGERERGGQNLRRTEGSVSEIVQDPHFNARGDDVRVAVAVHVSEGDAVDARVPIGHGVMDRLAERSVARIEEDGHVGPLFHDEVGLPAAV